MRASTCSSASGSLLFPRRVRSRSSATSCLTGSPREASSATLMRLVCWTSALRDLTPRHSSSSPYTIPATTLFATCVVYGRLSADNEILAVRASGINLTKVVGPALLLGLLTSAGTMGLYYRVIPHTHHLMRSLFLGDVEELL